MNIVRFYPKTIFWYHNWNYYFFKKSNIHW